jgi:membrane protein YqaA with SNARE-associated domain
MIKPIFLQVLSFTMPEWFNQLGLVAVFASSVIPFFPVPSEPIALGLLSMDSSTANILNISIIIAMGAFISHVIVYVAGSKFHLLHRNIKKQKSLRENHIFHKYGIWLFLIIPSISIVIPPLPDTLMAYLGHKRVNPMKLFAVVFIGELIRIPLTFLALEQLVKMI